MLRSPVLLLLLAVAPAARVAAGQGGLEDRLPAPLLLMTASDPAPFLHPENGVALVRALRDPQLDLPRLQALLAEIDALRGPVVLAVLSISSAEGRAPIPQIVLGVDLGGRAAEVQEMLRAKFAKASAGAERGLGLRAETLRIAGREVLGFEDDPARGQRGAGGSRLLVTFLDSTLVVASSLRSLERILTPQDVGPRDPRIASLRGDLGSGHGSLFVFADWKKLHPHVLAMLPPGQELLYRAAGLAGLDCLGIDVRPENDGFRTKVRFRFAGERTGMAAMPRPETKVKRFAQEHVPGRLAHLQLRLDKDHALAAFAHAFGPPCGPGERQVSPRARLAEGASRCGLDLDREVLARLGELVAFDVYAPDGMAGPVLVVALDATSPKEASSLVRALEGRLVARGLATTDKGILRISDRLSGSHAGAASIEVAVSGHRVLVGFAPGVLARYVAATSARKPAARVPKDVQASGIVELDHGEMVARLRAGLARQRPEALPPHRGPAGFSSGLLKADADGLSLEIVCRPAR